MIDKYEIKDRYPHHFHSVATIELGELIKNGVIKLEQLKWDCYNDDQFDRVVKKIKMRYWHREISIIPPGDWVREYMRLMNEIMPKYKLLYEQLDNGIDPFQKVGNYGKSRSIYSDFPQTQLNQNEDYASSGADKEYDNIETGDIIEKMQEFEEKYKDIDVMILDELKVLFSQLMTVNMNSF